jgi:hypothetical protein
MEYFLEAEDADPYVGALRKRALKDARLASDG